MKRHALPIRNLVPSIDEAINEYLLHQRSCRNSASTIQHYTDTIRKFQAWFEENGGTTVEDITTHAIRSWLVYLSSSVSATGKPMRSMTVWTHYKNFRVFINFLFNEEIIASNPMARVRAPKQDQTLLPAFTAAEIAKLEEATSGKDYLSIRTRALIYFMLDTGCRVAEVAKMKVDDVDMKTGTVFVRCGKGGKDRITMVGSKTIRALTKYLRMRPEVPGRELWVGMYGPMTRVGIRSTLEKLGKSCGVHCHAHKFRRTTALSMLRNGCDVYSIRNLLGHSDLQILQRYLAQTEVDIRLAHNRFGTVDHLR